MNVLVYLFLLATTSSKTFTFHHCNQTQIFNVATLQCSDCPPNMIPHLHQKIPTSCVCTQGFYPDSDNICTSYGLSICP